MYKDVDWHLQLSFIINIYRITQVFLVIASLIKVALGVCFALKSWKGYYFFSNI